MPENTLNTVDTRRVGSLIDPRSGLKTIQLPDPTDMTANVNEHIKTIQSNALESYNQLGNVLDYQTQLKNQSYADRQARLQNQAGKGNNLLEGFASIGKAVTDGWTAFKTVENEQIKLDYEIEEKKRLKQETKDEEAKKELYAQAYVDLAVQMDDIVDKTDQYIQEYGQDAGVELMLTELRQILSSDQYSKLPAEYRAEVYKYWKSLSDNIQTNQTKAVQEAQEKNRARQIDGNRSNYRLQVLAPITGRIEAGDDINEVAKDYQARRDAFKQQLAEANGGDLDEGLWLDLVLPLDAEFAKAIEKRYGEDAKNSREAQAYIELNNLNANLEAAVAQGLPDENGNVMTDAARRAIIVAKSRELGLDISDPDKELPTSTRAQDQQQVDDLARDNRRVKELDERNNRITDPDELVKNEQAIRAAQANIIYGAVNGHAGSEAQIAHIKKNAGQYSPSLQNVPAKVDEFKNDREKWQSNYTKILELKKQVQTITGQVDSKGNPTGNAETMKGLSDQIDYLQAVNAEIQNKWNQWGLDIKNPANKAGLDRINAQASATNTDVDNNPTTTPNTNNNTPTPTPVASSQEIRDRAVSNASRKNRANVYDQRTNQRTPQNDPGSTEYLKDAKESIKAQSLKEHPNDPVRANYAALTYEMREEALNKLEGYLQQGMNPKEALQRVRSELTTNLNQQYNLLGQKSSKSAGFQPDSNARELVDKTLTMFDKISKDLVSSFTYYEKQFGGGTRQAEKPKNENPSQRSQSNNGADYANSSVAPDKPDQNNPNKPSVPYNTALSGDQNGRATPVAAGNTVTTEIGVTKNGQVLKVNASTDQVVATKGGIVTDVRSYSNGTVRIVVKTPDGYYEVYDGMSQSYWKKHDRVKPGQRIGKATRTQSKPTSGTVLGEGAKISSPYGNRTHPVTGEKNKHHDGLDITNEATDDVTTIQGGTVVWASDANDNYGTTVIVRTPDGRYEQFSHLAETKVKVGDTVSPGSIVGLEGSTGRVTGKHLHFEVHTQAPVKDGKRVYGETHTDPQAYLNEFSGGGKDGKPSSVNQPSKSRLAKDNTTYVEVVNTGRKRENGNPIIKVRVIQNGKVIKEYDAVSGQPDRQGADRNKGGSKAPAPNGVWTIGAGQASNVAGVGGTFVPMTPTFGTGRAAIGFHYQDYAAKGGNKGTAGCIGFTSREEFNEFNQFLKANPNLKVDVMLNHTVEEETSGGGGTGGSKYGGKFQYSVYQNDPLDKKGNFAASSQSDPMGYLSTVQTKIDNSNKQGNNNGDSAGGSGIYELSPGVYLMPNGRVLDVNTGQIRNYNNEKKGREMPGRRNNNGNGYSNNGTTNRPPSNGNKGTGNREHIVEPRNMSITKDDYKDPKTGKVSNNHDDNYGYSLLAKDDEFREALHDAADELGVPTVWLADIMAYESIGFTYAKRCNQWGYCGLIQAGDAARKDAGVTREELLNMSLAEQVKRVVLPYLKKTLQYAGKSGYNTMEDILFAIWGGAGKLKASNQNRYGTTDGLNGTRARSYLDKVGSHAGRQYAHGMRGK